MMVSSVSHIQHLAISPFGWDMYLVDTCCRWDSTYPPAQLIPYAARAGTDTATNTCFVVCTCKYETIL